MAVIDIACPSCGRSDPVWKAGIGTYRCSACDHEFDRGAIDPAGRSDGSPRR